MKKHSVATIVNFCSNESRFIKATLTQAQVFSTQVIVVVCDHFFDGTPENRELLEQIYAAFPEVLFIEYPFLPLKIPKKMWKTIEPAHFWHSFSRLIGHSFLDEDVEMVLFLDADEVPDAKCFSEWLDSSDYMQHTALKFANYWYFREPTNQAVQYEDSIVLAQKKALERDILLNQAERDAIYNLLPGPKRRRVTRAGGEPMFHHYSWVRTQEEMLKKVESWGHKNDKDWPALVNEEFSMPFRGTDFVHGYQYKQVKPLFDIHFDPPLFSQKAPPQIKRLSKQATLKYIRPKKFWFF